MSKRAEETAWAAINDRIPASLKKARLIWNPGSGSIEAQNFTPWLAENLDRLSAALGIRLEHPMSLITSSCTTSLRSTSGVLAFWATLPADPVARPGDG